MCFDKGFSGLGIMVVQPTCSLIEKAALAYRVLFLRWSNAIHRCFNTFTARAY